MATLKKSYDDILAFRNAAQQFINRTPERTKLHYALEKVQKKIKSHVEDYADLENDIRVDCALLDNGKFTYIETGRMGEKMLATDPTKAKDQQKRIRDLGRKEVDVEVFFIKGEIPKDVEAAWYAAFLGWVIDEEQDPYNESETVMKKLEEVEN
jgi:hypothetical protein